MTSNPTPSGSGGQRRSGAYYPHADQYFLAGWQPFPLRGKDQDIPSGVTGRAGKLLLRSDVVTWMVTNPDHNIGLRLDGVIGIDIDNYRKGGIEKRGWHTLKLAIERWGPLPATWRSTARPQGGASGILFFRVPPGFLGLVSQLIMADADGNRSGDIEICQYHHRYAVVAPSIHPDLDCPYVWYDPAGNRVIGLVPNVWDLPWLPQTWFDGLLELGAKEVGLDPALVEAQRAVKEDWHPFVAQRFNDGVEAMSAPVGSRHDSVGFVLGQLTGDERRGLSGATTAIEALRPLWGVVLGPEREREFESMLEWSRARAASQASLWERNRRLVTQVFGNIRHTIGTVRTEPTGPLPVASIVTGRSSVAPNLPDDFWAARSLLAQVRQAAWSRIQSPDAVLGAVMARQAALTPPAFRLPPIVGAPASVAWYVALCGPPNSGKTTSIATATRLLSMSGHSRVVERPLGSGEGLVELYLGFEAEEQNGKTVQVRKQTKDGAFVTLDEGSALAEMAGRSGATLLPFLRSMWTGGRVGTSNASAETTRYLPDGSYSLGLVVGFQPALAAALLADDAAGTPQRFIWASGTDPRISGDATWPGMLRPPALQLGREARQDSNLDVAGEVVTEIRTAALARARAEVVIESLDAHRDLLRLKAAGLLAMLDGRLAVTVEDWQLAGVMVDTSAAVRAQVLDAVAMDAASRTESGIRAHAAKAKAAVVASHEVEDDRAQRALELAAVNVARRARKVDTPLSRRDATQAIKSTYRKAGVTVDDAIAHAIEAGWLVEVEGGYGPGPTEP